MKNKIMAVAAAAVIAFSAAPVHANSSDPSTGAYSDYSALATPSPTSPATRTISTEGNGHVVDNITDAESDTLQFITVTAKDGNVFYIVIDKQNSNDNVYLLNTVDESDLAALVKDYTPTATATPTPTATTEPGQMTEKPETKQIKSSFSPGMVLLIFGALGLAAAGIYYTKVIMPKKKLEEADDLEDFDFEDDVDTEEVVNEDYIAEDNEEKN